MPLIFNKVIENNPSTKLILVGKDVPDIISGKSSTWQMMQELFSEKAKINVDYLGSVPYSEIKIKIEEATVCVFPSLAEALPVSWLEAMAMKKAIVASNVGWANEMIMDGESGFLVSPNNHNLFASRIIQLLDDSNLRIKMGENARSRVKKLFDTDKVAKDNIDFYKSLID